MSEAERLIDQLVEAGDDKSADKAFGVLKKEFDDWEADELKDVISSVSSSMSADAKKVWKRYQELKKKFKK